MLAFNAVGVKKIDEQRGRLSCVRRLYRQGGIGTRRVSLYANVVQIQVEMAVNTGRTQRTGHVEHKHVDEKQLCTEMPQFGTTRS